MPGTKTIDKAIVVLKHVLAARGGCRAGDIATALDIPVTTVYRHINALERQGLLRRKSRATYSHGIFLLRLFDPEGFCTLLAEAARPVVADLASRLSVTSHLGVFEGDMVTYLVKAEPEKYGIFTRESTQLDAYCSGLGKILLSGLSTEELDTYFAGGELAALTKTTITNENDLRNEIAMIRERDYAIDNGEFEENLYCIAAPIRDMDGQILAALSVSSHSSRILGRQSTMVLESLKVATTAIIAALYNHP